MSAEGMKVLAAGARVEIRSEAWMVRSARRERSGGQAVRVVGLSPLVKDKEATFLTKLDDVKVLRPEETTLRVDDSKQFTKTRLYLESMLRRSPVSDRKIHLAHEAAIDPAEYQLRPAYRALDLPRPRFLMADGVGLGKTIEVGALLTELIRRNRGRRILVVAMKSILAQFQEELWARFTIPLVRLDSVGIQRVQSKVPSTMNPFHFFDRVIVSIDTLKNDVKYRQYLENCRWDAVVIDECQNIAMRSKSARGAASQRYRLAQLLAKQCDALIFTSATPHDGRAESFASIVRLLEPTAIADVDDFGKEDVEPFFQRKFKKDVAHEMAESFPPRETEHEHLQATPQENAFFTRIQETTFRTLDGKKRSGSVLFRTTLLKAFLSSPRACIETIEKRLGHRDLHLDDLEGDAAVAAHADITSLEELRDLAEAAETAGSRKYDALLEKVKGILASKEGPGRVVIFSERIATLDLLRDRLAADLKLKYEPKGKKNAIETFHGSLDDQSQMDLVKSFGTEDSSIRVLLASDAAAEGINLHYFCHHLIHFDLPWSLITLVQRNGRIDRFGQKNTPVIHYLITKPESQDLQGDLRVLDRLVEKEEQVQKNLGDPATLMNLHDPELEEKEIALAAQGEKDAAVVLPDEPAGDADSSSWFDKLMANAGEEEPEIQRASPPGLFEDDLDFARAAFPVIGVELAHQPSTSEGATTVEWGGDGLGFDLVPSEDLKRRYDYLPSELTRDRQRFRLTSDRSRVMQHIEIARQREKEWPEWELFWAHHPICEWIDDKVMSELGRHEAWVVPVSGDLDGHDAVFLFQGVQSNQNGQPVIVDWFGIPFSGKTPAAPLALERVLELSGLQQARGNPGSFDVPDQLQACLEPAVEAARSHMEEQRRETQNALAIEVRDGTRKLADWRTRSLRRLDEQEARSRKGTAAAPAPVRKRIQAERREIEALYAERKSFVDRIRAVEEPYLRVAAVIVRADLA